MDLITIKTYDYPAQLAIAKSYLESEGVQCFIKDELISQSCTIFTGASGGVKLQVEAANVESAIQLLINGGFAKRQDFEDQPTPEIQWLEKVFSKLRRLFEKA